jgi:hypothetical protein
MSAVANGGHHRSHAGAYFGDPVGAAAGEGADLAGIDDELGDNRDRLRVAGGEDYEVQYLANETGITHEQARELIKRYGNDRDKLVEHARNLRG